MVGRERGLAEVNQEIISFFYLHFKNRPLFHLLKGDGNFLSHPEFLRVEERRPDRLDSRNVHKLLCTVTG